MAQGNLDIWKQASARYTRRKLSELVSEWQSQRKAQGLPSTKADLADEIHVHRNTLSKWLNGQIAPPIEELCSKFNVTPDFFVAQNLDEMDLVDEQHHKWMQEDAAEAARKYHVSKSFLWYLKSDPDAQHEILNNQPTDGYLNSFDPDVPDVGSPFQFSLKNGKKAYLNETGMKIIGELEREVRDYTTFKIWQHYKKKK